MTVSKKIALLATAVFWFAAAPMAVAVDDAATIRANTEAWFKAFNTGNADAVAASYADDAVVMAPGSPPASGSAAIKQLIVKEMGGMKAGGVTLAQGKINDVASKATWRGTQERTRRSKTAKPSIPAATWRCCARKEASG